MILIYQMAKVASMTWTEAARAAAPSGAPEPIHVHYLASPSLDTLAAIVGAPEAKTGGGFVNPLVPRHLVRKGRDLAPRVAAARSDGADVRVITGIRDPVARSLSLVSFFGDFCGRRGGGISARDGASVDQVVRYVRTLWDCVLSGAAPEGVFDRLVWQLTGNYRSWFDDELKAVLGVDLMATDYPHGDVLLVGSPGARTLLYRVEDMHPAAPVHARLMACARDLLAAPAFDLVTVNTAETRRSYPLHAEAARRLTLPDGILDRIYEAPPLRHCYSAAELDAFRQRWRQR